MSRRHPRATPAALALLLGIASAAGCSDAAPPPDVPADGSLDAPLDASPTAGGAVASPGATTDTQTSAAPPPPAVDPAAVGPVELASGLDVPWGLAFLPDGSALVAERDSSRILQLAPDGTPPTEVAVVPGVVPDGEGGLLGLAVSPGYSRDGWVYAYLSASDGNRIVRFRLGATSSEPQDTEVVLDGIDSARIHNGGRIAFGPDGLLYAGTGDAGDPSSSQDPDDLNGKILRMTPTGDTAPGNPFDSVVFSLGHRNVQGLAWDGEGRLWATEFGQNTLDEVNLIEAGRNYGWPEVEGPGDTDGGRFTDPQVSWATSEASPSGAAVVSAAGGDTLYVAALRGRRLWQVPLDGDGAGEPTSLLDGRFGRLRSVATAPDGALWLTTSNTDGYGEARDGDDRVLRFAASPTR